MTEAENREAEPRAGRRFTILHNGAEIFPGAGAKLHYASRSDDTLTLPGMPPGMFAADDAVVCRYDGRTVFSGAVTRIIDRAGRGSDRVCDVTVGGPWSRLNRLVFRQQWATRAADGTAATFLFSRVVLNKAVTGEALDMSDQIREILAFGAAKCGYDVGTVSAGTTVLPPDDTRDLTCASAIQRVLRFHPKVVVTVDYSGEKPVVNVATPPEREAPYVAAIPMTAREWEINACPIGSVDVQTNDVTEINGGKVSAAGHQVYPPGADTAALDCLHVYIPLARGSGSNSYESCTLETEDMPSYVGDPRFWRDKHPRLANVAQSQIRISEATRTGTHDYRYIARNSASELAKAGISFDKEIFRCKCTVTTADDIEEDIYLSMEFLTTDRRGGTYTWQTGSSSASGETLPDGLAQALYEQRTQSPYLNETMTVRLGDTWPRIGDFADGLYLQQIDVDCASELATLHFGQTEYLSAEDMRDLLNGFRGRAYCAVEAIRSGADEEDAAEEIAGIPPLSSTEFSPGRKAKTTIGGGSSGSILLDATALASGQTVAVRKATVSDAAGERQVPIFAAEDVDLTAVKKINDIKGPVRVTGGDKISVTTEGDTIRISFDEAAREDKGPDADGINTSCADHPGSQPGGGVGAQTGDEPTQPGVGGGGGGVAAGGGGAAGVGCAC